MNASIERARTRLLHGEIRWLMNLRWAVGALVIGLGFVNGQWFRWYGLGYEPVLLGVAILAYNAIFSLAVFRWRRFTLRWKSLLSFASVQVHLDLACLTLLVVWSGGAASPLLGAYFFHMLFASLLQPRLRAYGIALVATVFLATGLWLSHQWPAARHDWLVVSGCVLMMFVTVYLTDRVTKSLYRREVARIRQYDRVHAMAAKLRAQQAVLVQGEKMAAMGEVAAGIAHEITNPLAAMDSILQLMQRRPADPTPDAIATLREQIQRILRIVRQLTAYAHPGRGRLETLQLNDVVRSSLELLALNSRARNVHVESVLPDSVGGVAINPHTFQQVLTNLMMNAIDATAERSAPRIVVRTLRDDEHVTVEISDNGTGIAPEHLPHIFEPFFTTKPVGRGTGLGLSICARLIREQHGRIEVDSTVGAGTTFRVLVPAPQSSPIREIEAIPSRAHG